MLASGFINLNKGKTYYINKILVANTIKGFCKAVY